METEREIEYYENMREVAALRHSFHIDSRLRLEFLSVVSRLLREHEVPVSNRLLSALIVAIPDELPDGNGREENSRAAKLFKAGKKSPKYRARNVPPPIEPIPPPIEPIPPPIEPIPPPIEPIPPMPPKRPPVPPKKKGGRKR